jgi:hypothetical protein
MHYFKLFRSRNKEICILSIAIVNSRGGTGCIVFYVTVYRGVI